LVWKANGYSGKEFLRTEVFELLSVHTNDPVATNLAMREMFETDLKEDYHGMEVICLHSTQGFAIQSKGYPVRKPGDMRGKRTRTPSRSGAWTLEELGAKPISVAVKSIPQTPQRNVATTVLLPFTANPLLKLHQHISHFTEGYNQTRFGSVVCQALMNQSRWESLLVEIKAAFRQASDENFLRKAGQVWHSNEQRGVDLIKKFNRKHIVLNDEDTEAFRIQLEPVVEHWIDEVSIDGIDGKALS
tara:strand:+ start:139 stop:873 length:735 start_codon:yes stop_codon:yes gene_type:complete